MVQNHLLLRSFQDILFHCAHRHEAVDVDVILLPDTVSSAHRLQVVLGVPIGVKDDDGVCGCEIDTQASSTRGQEEREIGGVVGVEVFHRLVSRYGGGRSIQALVLPSLHSHVV